jgi:hypothetical protein
VSNLWVTTDELDDYADNEYAYEAVKTASQILWSLSGRKYGGSITVTEKYVCASRAYRLGQSSKNYTPELVDGQVYNIPFDEFDDYAEMTTDGMSPSSRLRLRGRPVTQVHSVRDRTGKIVNPSRYYLVDHSTLQARSGVPWTPCNIEVTYTYGSPAPAAGRAAARVLATEFIKLWSGSDDCALPQRITSVSRQGVSYTILDNQDFIDDMRTGLYVVDLFLKSANPDKARAKARVFSTDIPRARRQVPKPLKLAASSLDMYVTGDEGAILEVNIDSINAAFLVTDDTWVPYLKISNWSGLASKDLESTSVSINTIVTDITKSVTYKQLTDNVATLTTSTSHGFIVGDLVTVSGINATFNGSYYITEVPTTTTFVYARAEADRVDDVTLTADTGTAVVTNESRDTLTLTVGYDEAYNYAGFSDPGTWDLYASRPDVSDPDAVETVYIASGNLALRLASNPVPTYTLGG